MSQHQLIFAAHDIGSISNVFFYLTSLSHFQEKAPFILPYEFTKVSNGRTTL